MHGRYIFYAILSLYYILMAQNTCAQNHWCASDWLQQQYVKQQPNSLKKHQKNNELIAKHIEQKLKNQSFSNKKEVETAEVTVITIPTVVHLIYDPANPFTGADLSNNQVYKAMEHLNDAFRNKGLYDPSSGVDMEIEFCLASIDPDGNATNGIKRWALKEYTDIDIATTIEDSLMKDKTRWNPFEYMNLWVVEEIYHSEFGENANVPVGYSYVPISPGSHLDGIVCEANYFGNSADSSKVAVHEVGHYFNLEHTFLSGCKNNNCLLEGDYVCDTPPDNTAKFKSCALYVNSCQTDDDDTNPYNPYRPTSLGGRGDSEDLRENYMDYSPFICQHLFTQGQKERARLSLELLRPSILASRACGSLVDRDIAIIDIVSPTEFNCSNRIDLAVTIVNLGEQTLNSAVIDYQLDGGIGFSETWDGNLKTGEAVNVLLSPALTIAEGPHLVSVTVSEPNGLSDQNTDNNEHQRQFEYLALRTPPLYDSFENGLSSKWHVINPDNGYTWEIVNFGGSCSDNGTRTLVMKNFEYTTGQGQTDMLVTNVDLSNTANALLSFDLAHIPFNNDFADRLNISISTDCGQSYQNIYEKEGSALNTVGGTGQNTQFLPLNCDHWRTEAISLDPFKGQEVLVAFTTVCRFGNNIYIDNIRIEGSDFTPCVPPIPLQIDELTASSANISWADQSNALMYRVRYRRTNTNDWKILTTVTNSITIDNLDAKVSYEIQVQTVCDTEGNESEYSGLLPFTLPDESCDTPTNLRALSASFNEVTLAWNPIPGVTTYNLRYRIVGQEDWLFEAADINPFTLTGLNNDRDYEVQIQAVCNSSLFGAFGNIATFSTLPFCTKPTGLEVVNTSLNNARLRWDEAEYFESYTFDYKKVGDDEWQQREVFNNEIFFEILEEETVYQGRVRTNCPGGFTSPYTNTVNFTTGSFCKAPTTLSILSVTNTTGSVSWNQGQDAVAYNLRYKLFGVAGAEWEYIENIEQTNYVLDNLTMGTIYQFQVASVCEGRESSYTPGIHTFTTTASCDPPQNIAIEWLTNDKVDVCWSPAVLSYVSEIHYRRVWPTLANKWTDFITEDTCTKIDELDANSVFKLRIKSICSAPIADDSEFSEELFFGNVNDGSCLPVFNATAKQITDKTAALDWYANGNSYDIRYKITEENTWKIIENVQVGYTLENLLASTEYEFQVKSHCDEESSEFNESAFFTTIEGFVCDTPNDLRLTEATGNYFLTAWTAVEGAASYRIRYKVKGTSEWRILTPPSNSASIEGLIPCTEYNIGVQAVCENGGESYYSSSITAVTIDCEEGNYCTSESSSTTAAWISSVKFGSFEYKSGNDQGYGKHTTIVFQAYRHLSHNILLKTGYPKETEKVPQYWHIWIDFDQSSTFDSKEKVFTRKTSTFGEGETAGGLIRISDKAKLGNTRLRIAMTDDEFVSACEALTNGEVEDYTLNIGQLLAKTDAEKPVFRAQLHPNPAQQQVAIYYQQNKVTTSNSNIVISIFDIQGKICATQQQPNEQSNGIIPLNIAHLSKGIYFVHLNNGQSNWMEKLVITK